MASEHLLNYYYNIGGFNKPQRIGYMMNMIRRLKPLTMDEWEIWYLENVHDKEYIEDISIEMHESVPAQYGVTLAECRLYVYDVMFRRTFQGYNKEKVALRQLREIVSDKVQDAPKEWDTDYFIDFYIPEEEYHPMIGIQLKPETFYCVLRSLAVVGAVSSGRSAVGERSTGVLYRPAVVYKLLAFL